jgi:type IV pilus assembly protein PilF
MTLALHKASLVFAAAVALLAGCAATGGAGSPTTATPDRVTASDESDATKRARVRLELASAYFGRGMMTTALDEVKLAIAADPTVSAAFNLRGLIYASLGDEQLAEESFRRALQLDGRDADAMQNYGWYLCQRQRYDEAEALFDRAAAVPQYRDVQRTLTSKGVCQARQGEWARAEQTLMKAYEMNPGNPLTAVNLSEVLYHRGGYERARFYMRRVNDMENVANAQTLWLALRIERRLGNDDAVRDLSFKLRSRFPQSRETAALNEGRFDG